MAKSTCPELSDTTFFARWQCTLYERVSGACSSRKIFEIEVIAQEDFKKLRCNLVHFRKCLDSILNVYY